MTVANDASTSFGVPGAGSIVVLDVLVEAEDVELIAKGLGKTPETATGVDIDSSFSGAGEISTDSTSRSIGIVSSL